MSVQKYKDPITKEWVKSNSIKVLTEYVGGSVSGVPSDIVAEAERVVGVVQNRKTSGNTLKFIVVSDMHEMGDNDNTSASILEQYRRANLNAGQGARLIAEKINPDFFANLGDLAWGNLSSTSPTTTLGDLVQSVVKARGYTAPLEALTECFYTPGNHDVDYIGGYLDASILTNLIGSYRYVDLTAKKVRVICLNTADTTDGTQDDKRISGEQLQWFAEALDLSGKSNAADWSIVVLSHHPIDWNEGNNIIPAARCLAAYLNGTTYSVTHDGVSISKNYSGKNAAKFIANFHGHVHCFKVGTINGTSALRVAIPNACYARTNEYGEEGNTTFGETTSYEKKDNGTGKNTAFCVVTVDLDEDIIYADCFGAGYDRVIGAETWSVTNVLANASTNNGATIVTKGAEYKATITANSGYEISSIKVTMGGNDVTAQAVKDGNRIEIGSVTGDVAITVTTVQSVVPPSYNNLVDDSINADGSKYMPPNGYQEGYRLNSSGTTSELAGAANCGFIPFNGEAICVWGTKSSTIGSTGNYIGLYDANFAYIYAIPGNSWVNQGGTWVAKDGKYMITLDPAKITDANIKNYFASATYIRVSMVQCKGADLVVTLDEPIE